MTSIGADCDQSELIGAQRLDVALFKMLQGQRCWMAVGVLVTIGNDAEKGV